MKKLRLFPLVLVAGMFGFPIGAFAQADAAVPFSLVRTGLVVRVDYEHSTLAGVETLTVRNASTTPAAEIPLLLNRSMTLERVTAPSGAALAFSQSLTTFADDTLWRANAARVRLSQPVQPGRAATIVAHFGGGLSPYAETGSVYIRDHINREFTILREDAFAFPTLGAASRTSIRSVVREPFAFSLSVTVPRDLVVATGGRRRDLVRHDSLVTWRYESEKPVPFLNIAIAPYRVVEQDGSRFFHFPQDSSGARTLATATAKAVGQLTAWYGETTDRPHLTVIEIPEGWGSQASLTGGIIQTADAFRSRAQHYQLYHELTHLWNVADLDRPSPRWNEGLATFLQWRLAEQLDGWNDWPGRVQRYAESASRVCRDGVRCTSTPFTSYGQAGMTDLSYPVGALMFYALHTTLGAEDFDARYREFYQRYRSTGASSQVFAQTFAAAGPAARAIIDDWFLTTGWYRAMRSGKSVQDIIAGYKGAGQKG